MQETRKPYLSIQYLRAIAAIMVVAVHAGHPIEGLYPGYSGFGMGHAGVDIFFVISGFIMWKAARSEPPGEFLRRRLTRVWPLYAIATLATYAFFARFSTDQMRTYDVSDLLQSLAFIPHYSPRAPGNIWPFLIPGWTLNYEMFFYGIFAVGIWSKRTFAFTLTIIVAFVLAGLMVKSGDPAVRTYTSPIMLEFLAGMAIARWSENLPRWASLLLPVGFAILVFNDSDAINRVLRLGIPAIMIVLGALAIEQNWRLPYFQWWKRLGDASYAIYLFQIIAITMATMVLWHLPIRGVLQSITMILLCVGGSIAAGVIVHLLLEKPLTRVLIKRRGSRNMIAPAQGVSIAAPGNPTL